MLPNSSACSPLLVQDLFRALLAHKSPSNMSSTNQQTLQSRNSPQLLSTPPKRNSIRYVNNDQNNSREKYDGHRWRLICNWNKNGCTNLVYYRGLCAKHYAQQKQKLPKVHKKPLIHQRSLPNRMKFLFY